MVDVNWFKKQSMMIKVIVVVIGLFVLSAVVSGVYDGIFGEDEASTDSKEVANDSKEEKEDKNDAKEPEEDREVEEDNGNETKEELRQKKIDINKEIKLGNVTIDLQNVTIEGDKLSIWAWWFHGAGREKIHFSVLATLSVLQDGEYLDVTDGEDTLLRQTDYGVDSNIDIEYQLLDNETPVEIRFRTTTDEPEEETIEIDID